MLQLHINKQLANFTLDVSLACKPGALTAIVGPSGAGKTTLLRIISGLERPDRGTIMFGGTIWDDVSRNIHIPTRQRKIGLVFQEYPLFPHLTICKNVAFAAPHAGHITQLLCRFGIDHLAMRKPGEISGGERQRAALCQTLASRPALLLLDEPFSALDVATRTALREELRSMKGTLDIPILHITHDLEEAYTLADDIFVMERGRASPQWLQRQNFGGNRSFRF